MTTPKRISPAENVGAATASVGSSSYVPPMLSRYAAAESVAADTPAGATGAATAGSPAGAGAGSVAAATLGGGVLAAGSTTAGAGAGWMALAGITTCGGASGASRETSSMFCPKLCTCARLEQP